MNSRRLWNSHQRHTFFEGRGILGHFENQSLGNGVSRAFQEVFSSMDAMLFRPITHKTQDWEQCRRNVPGVPRHCTVRTFHRSKPKYAFKVIQNWETDALQYISFGGAYFRRQLWQKKMKLARGFGPLPTLIDSAAFIFSKAYRRHPQNKLLQNERYFAKSSPMTHSLSLSLGLL